MAGTFAKTCVAQMCREGYISKLSSHGLATSLWAVARLRLDTREVSSLCSAVAREVDLASLQTFTSVELSISMWAMAKMIRKCVRRSEAARCQPQGARPCYGAAASESASTILLALTDEAFRRSGGEFGPQGLTNMSWALTTLELTGHSGAASLAAVASPVAGNQQQDADSRVAANAVDMQESPLAQQGALFVDGVWS